MKKILLSLFIVTAILPVFALNKTVFSAVNVTGHSVVIDPGHGGSDYGSTECASYTEKEANLDIALKLEKLLKDDGARVYLTRTDNETTLSNAYR